MLVKSHDNPFPRRSDIETLLDDGSYKEIVSILAEQGVFILGRKQGTPDHIVRFLFGESFYEKAFSTLSRSAYGISITGQRATLPPSIDLLSFFQSQIEAQPLDHKYEPKIINVTEKSNSINISIQYTKINPRFSEYRRRDLYQIEVVLNNISPTEIEFTTYPKTSTDSLVARDVILASLDKIRSTPKNIDIEDLPVKNRVEIFDKILNSSPKSSWRVKEVCGLTIRSGSSEYEGSESDEINIPDSDVQLLQSAILEGKNLRDHKIVQDLLKENYYFSAASVWALKQGIKGSLNEYKVRIEFKKKPQVLIVSVSESRAPNTANDSMEYSAVPEEIGRESIMFFWNLVHQVYTDCITNVSKTAKSVTRQRALKDNEEFSQNGNSDKATNGAKPMPSTSSGLEKV